MDIDNTVFDWVEYYSHAYQALIDFVAAKVGASPEQIAEESKGVFTRFGSIEYPFAIQELPSVLDFYGEDIDTMLKEAVEPGREAFLAAAASRLQPYEGVVETLAAIRSQNPDLPIVALTDAPRYVAMWKLNKLGILHSFDAVYGLADPRIPTCEKTNRVKVSPTILLKHLQQSNFDFAGKIRILPDEYEKPGTRGLKTVLMDFGLDEDADLRAQVYWIGDNRMKDIGLGKTLGVYSIWARYGTLFPRELYEILHAFSPEQNIRKHAQVIVSNEELPEPDVTLESFPDLLALFRGRQS